MNAWIYENGHEKRVHSAVLLEFVRSSGDCIISLCNHNIKQHNLQYLKQLPAGVQTFSHHEPKPKQQQQLSASHSLSITSSANKDIASCWRNRYKNESDSVCRIARHFQWL